MVNNIDVTLRDGGYLKFYVRIFFQLAIDG